MLDIELRGWGLPPTPLLPAPLRQLWSEEQLPSWLAEELHLPSESTYGTLDADAWSGIREVSERALNALADLLRSRLREAWNERCLPIDAWPVGVSLDAALFSTRSRNILREQGFLARPEPLIRMSFGDLLRVPKLGVRSALEISCTLEALTRKHRDLVDRQTLESDTPTGKPWTERLAEAATQPWVDSICEGDPRFASLLPPGAGPLTERIEHCLADPGSLFSIIEGPELADSIGHIAVEVSRIEGLTLEASLLDLVEKSDRGKRRSQRDALLPRLGWDGRPPRTLEDVGLTLGVTRERVRQIESRFLRELPSQIFLPKLDIAIEILEKAAPLPVEHAAKLLIAKDVCALPMPVESILRAAQIFQRETDLKLERTGGISRIVVTSVSYGDARSILRVTRKLAGMAGVASVFQIADELSAGGKPTTPEDARQVLDRRPNVEFLNEDWFWVTDIPVRRNRLSNIAKKILSVASPQSVSSIRDGLRRAFLFRAKSNPRYVGLTVPPSHVLAAFFAHSPEFKIAGAGVSLASHLDYADALGEVDRAIVEVFRSTASGVLDRRSIVEACLARGLNENSVSMFLTYSPVLEHVELDVWKLRGVRVDPTAIEALREANASSPVEKRLLSFGWRPNGKLWVASRVPYTTASFVLGVPGTVKRFLADRRFAAIDRASGAACGHVSVNESGTSFGYSTFFRRAGAEPNDVLLAEFDLGREMVELSLTDETILESETLEE